MLRIIKILFRIVFSAHAIALVFLGYIARDLHRLIGAPLPARVFTFDSWMALSALFGVVLFLGWLAGNEFRSLQVRTLRRMLGNEREHAGYLRHLNANMIDDVLLAARHGVPVKSFGYASQSPQVPGEAAAHDGRQ
jgi:hypothetical protein